MPTHIDPAIAQARPDDITPGPTGSANHYDGALAKLADYTDEDIRLALRPEAPRVLQVLVLRATGQYIGERAIVTKHGERIFKVRLDPCPRSAQILLERALGRVRDAPGGDTPALPEYVRLMIDALRGGPVTVTAQRDTLQVTSGGKGKGRDGKAFPSPSTPLSSPSD